MTLSTGHLRAIESKDQPSTVSAGDKTNSIGDRTLTHRTGQGSAADRAGLSHPALEAHDSAFARRNWIADFPSQFR
jgi:hypothetical protein